MFVAVVVGACLCLLFVCFFVPVVFMFVFVVVVVWFAVVAHFLGATLWAGCGVFFSFIFPVYVF